MPNIAVTEFEFSERADTKMWEHGIDFDVLSELPENRYVTVRNRRHRAADVMLIGRDNSGRYIVTPILPTSDPLIWRPVTAWYCKPSEEAILRQRRSVMDAAARYESSQEPLDDKKCEHLDSDNWVWNNPVEIVGHDDFGFMCPISFIPEEVALLEPIAHGDEMTIHESIKRAALAHLLQEQSR